MQKVRTYCRRGPESFFSQNIDYVWAENNVDGALEKKEVGSLVENYVWKIKVVELRKDKAGFPLYLGMTML